MSELSSRNTETLGRELREDFSRFLTERKYANASDKREETTAHWGKRRSKLLQAYYSRLLREPGDKSSDTEPYEDGDDWNPPEPKLKLTESNLSDLPGVAIAHIEEEQRIKDWHDRWAARFKDFFALPSIPPDSVTLWSAAWYAPPGVEDTEENKTKLSLLEGVCAKHNKLALKLALKRLTETKITLRSRFPDCNTSSTSLEKQLELIKTKIDKCKTKCEEVESKLNLHFNRHNDYKKTRVPTGEKCMWYMHGSIKRHLAQEAAGSTQKALSAEKAGLPSTSCGKSHSRSGATHSTSSSQPLPESRIVSLPDDRRDRVPEGAKGEPSKEKPSRFKSVLCLPWGRQP